MSRRAVTAALTGLAQASMILLGTAAAIDWDISPAARAIGAAVCLLGMFWIQAEAAFWARREGFAQGRAPRARPDDPWTRGRLSRLQRPRVASAPAQERGGAPMIRAAIFAAIVGGATWAADLYDRWIRNERNEK